MKPAPLPDQLLPPGLRVLARASWPASHGGAASNGGPVSPRDSASNGGAASHGDAVPPVPGFVISTFSPLAAVLADRCLRDYFGGPPADTGRGQRTGVLLASHSGDLATAAAVAQATDAGRRVPPLLFFQSNPNAVVGHITARWGLTGPVVCTSPAASGCAGALIGACLLIDDGDADAALVIVAEQGRPGTHSDHGVAMLVGPASWPPATGRAGRQA